MTIQGSPLSLTVPAGGHADCAILIVTHNSAADIGGLLDSLPAAAGGLTWKTIVVDNGSTDGTVELVRQRADVVLVQAANRGYAAGINVGRARAGDCSALLVLNPDIRLAGTALADMFALLGQANTGIVVPMLVDTDGHRHLSLRREPTLARAIGDCLLGGRMAKRPGWLSEIVAGDDDYQWPHAVDWATGAIMLISANCDRAVGRWDESYFMYSEEVDYAARARAAGFAVHYLPTARAVHSGGGSGQSNELTALMAVNRVRYAEKNGRWRRMYRFVVILHELLRIAKPAHRSALRAVLRRGNWPVLVHDLSKGQAGEAR